MNQDLTFFSLCSFNRILEVARCSQLTDVGFTTLARVSVSLGSVVDFYRFSWIFISEEAAKREIEHGSRNRTASVAV